MSDDNVTRIKPLTEADIDTSPVRVTRQFEPDPEIVKFVEELLSSAKSGKMRAIAVAVVYHNDLVPDGEADHGWAVIIGSVHWALDRAIHRLHYFWNKHTHEG